MLCKQIFDHLRVALPDLLEYNEIIPSALMEFLDEKCDDRNCEHNMFYHGLEFEKSESSEFSDRCGNCLCMIQGEQVQLLELAKMYGLSRKWFHNLITGAIQKLKDDPAALEILKEGRDALYEERIAFVVPELQDLEKGHDWLDLNK